MSHNVTIGIVVLLIVLSIIFQIMIGVLYQNMINETDNMTATDNQMLKQCKKKFANCYRMNGGVTNIPVFVDKFINHLRIGNISLISLQHWSGQLVLFSVFVSGMGIYTGITKGDRFISLMPYYIISLIGLYVYFGVSSAIDITGKKQVLKTNLVDYMENHMVKRLELLPESMRMADMTEDELGFRKRRIGAAGAIKTSGYQGTDTIGDTERNEDEFLLDAAESGDMAAEVMTANVMTPNVMTADMADAASSRTARMADKLGSVDKARSMDRSGNMDRSVSANRLGSANRSESANRAKSAGSAGHMGDDELEMLLREFLS